MILKNTGFLISEETGNEVRVKCVPVKAKLFSYQTHWMSETLNSSEPRNWQKTFKSSDIKRVCLIYCRLCRQT